MNAVTTSGSASSVSSSRIPSAISSINRSARSAGIRTVVWVIRNFPDRPRDRAVGLLTALPAVGEIDQTGPQQHSDVEVQVPRVDSQPLSELAVRQRPLLALAQHLENPQPQRMAEGLQLLRTVDGEDV